MSKLSDKVRELMALAEGGEFFTLDHILIGAEALEARVVELEQAERDHHEFYCLGVSDDS